MESIALKASLRKETGKKSSKEARQNELVPCVLYGGAEHVTFQVCEADFRNVVYTPIVYLVQLNIDGKEYQAILKDLQFDPVSDKLIHVDFLEVLPGKPVTIELPVKIVGSSIGVREGGKMVVEKRKLKVKGLASKLPGEIAIDVTSLAVGKAVKVGNLKSEDYEIVASPDTPVVSVRPTRATAGAPEAKK
jgi:large subunit ribosomal protein L25